MQSYSSNSGKKSGVTAYEIGEDFIIVRFGTADYKYSYSSCGQSTTELMKGFALASEGLSTFISQADPAYEWKR